MKVVQVYWNRTRKCWSVRDAKTRRVVEHRSHLLLTDVRFHVSRKGVERIRLTGRRSVVAWAQGELQDPPPETFDGVGRVYFNPKAEYTFFDDMGEQVWDTRAAYFNASGQVWIAEGPQGIPSSLESGNPDRASNTPRASSSSPRP